MITPRKRVEQFLRVVFEQAVTESRLIVQLVEFNRLLQLLQLPARKFISLHLKRIRTIGPLTVILLDPEVGLQFGIHIDHLVEATVEEGIRLGGFRGNLLRCEFFNR